jgi:hypothetical protein
MKIIYILLFYNILSLRLEKSGNYRIEKEISDIAAKIIKEYSKSFSTNSNIIKVNNDKANESKINLLRK